MSGWSDLLTPIAIGSLSAVLATWLAMRRFRTERWWERKAEAYSALMGHLADIEIHAEDWLRDAYGEMSLGDGRRKDMERLAMNAQNKLRRSAAVGAFLISEEASMALNAFFSRLAGHWHETSDLHSYVEGELAAVRAAKERLRVAARQDLRLGLRWFDQIKSRRREQQVEELLNATPP